MRAVNKTSSSNVSRRCSRKRPLDRGKWGPQGRKLRTKKEKSAQPLKLPEPTDLVFAGDHSGLFNKILEQENLKFDRESRAGLGPDAELHIHWRIPLDRCFE